MNQLEQIVIACQNVAAGEHAFSAICGAPFESANQTRQQAVGRALITLDDALGRPQGLQFIRFGTADLAAVRTDLNERKVDFIDADELTIPAASANGVEVRLGNPLTIATDANVPARFDHVALAVADLDEAAARWAAITATEPVHLGEHPLGKFNATRFISGPHMIELVSPKRGVDSPIATRLEQRGEGVMAVAIIASDLDDARSRISAAGLRLVEDPPHVYVHPRDAAGILVQLTPRLAH
jgi:catechol 2,3-dioxygenase-like lactoylglutathione lyase family enzyme